MFYSYVKPGCALSQIALRVLRCCGEKPPSRIKGVSCQLFTVNGGQILSAGNSALSATSQNRERCTTFTGPRQRKARPKPKTNKTRKRRKWNSL